MTAGAAQVNPWLAHAVVIDRIAQEIPGVATYHLRFAQAQAAEDYRFEPGQFNMLYLPGVGESAISLSADPHSCETWAHTIRTAGNVTGALARLGAGSSLGLRGPFGTSWPLAQARDKHVVLAAGGIGLAPLRPAIYAILAARDEFSAATLLYGSRSPDLLLYETELPEWSRRGMDVQVTVDRAGPGWAGQVGVVPLLLDRLALADPRQTVVLMCGPEVMMRYTVRSALRLGVPVENLWVSLERNMQCAVGLCGHCQLGPAFICKDGPVFRYDRIAPFLDVESL